ncbi:MAG: mechanosensitive ion channel family protein [Candidatus Baldrarchaeia archaeon]|nr:mechanosensitive ion channel family protein [Candidatus Baldrarchaeota archaeon]
MQEFLNLLGSLWSYIATATGYLAMGIRITIIFIIIAIIERIITRYIRKVGKQVKLDPDIINGLVLITRFFIIIIGVIAILEVGGIPAGWLATLGMTLGTLGGVAIGLASTRTIGNFISGLYILISRPFEINDYVNIKGIEGIVKEITINYTKILTADRKMVLISNQEVLGANITRFSLKEGEYCYTLDVSFDHSLTKEELERIFNRVVEEFSEKVSKKPQYTMVRLSRSERVYRFYLYFKNPEDLFTVPSEFLAKITEAWDQARTKNKL